MTKYSTPSIEVVTFNPSDAPRIGMQWWVLADELGTSYLPLGQNWTPPSGNPLRGRCAAVTYPFFGNDTVSNYACDGETIPGAYINQYGTVYVVDDGKSC